MHEYVKPFKQICDIKNYLLKLKLIMKLLNAHLTDTDITIIMSLSKLK